MTSLRNFIAAVAVSLPLLAAAQAPAEAKAPLYSFYGTLNGNLQWSEAHDSAAGIGSNIRERMSVSIDSSNVGIRGTANVAHGLGVTYQCETSAAFDGITTNVAATPAVLTFLCNRNSRLGLTHGTYGTIFLGNWDTPFKSLAYGTKADDPFGNTDAFGANDIMGEGPTGGVITSGFATSSTSRIASFDVRASNSVAYWSPKIMGLGLRAQHAVNEFSNNRNVAALPGTTTLNPSLTSVGVNYDRGPFSVGAAWEMHRDVRGLRAMGLNATDSPSDDRGWRVAAGYELPNPFGATTVGVVYESLKYTQRRLGAGQIREYSRPALGANVKHRMGPHEFRGRFNWADKGDCEFEQPVAGAPGCDPSGTSAHQVTLGYAYYLATSTQVFASWTKLSNGRLANYSLSAGGGTTGSNLLVGANLPAGADPQALGVGIRYAF
jgi:predicted porin